MSVEKTKVLIVDDVPANILALETVLRPLNLELLTANSGNEAIGQILRHDGIALVLLDVQMPEMDGFETAELIRQDEDSCNIPIIFVTAISTEDRYVFKGYQAGAVDYLFKPVDSDILLSKVKIFVQLHEQQLKTRRALEELERVENARRLLLDNAAEGIIGTNRDLTINFANTAAANLLKSSVDQLVGKPLKTFVAPDMEVTAWAESSIVEIASSAGKQHLDDWMFTDTEGNEFHAEFTQVGIVEHGKLVGGVMLFRDITYRVEAQKKLLQLAQYDTLTGLANRALFWNYLSKAIATSKRHNQSFLLLYIDLDRFKQVNDTLGHLAGDLLLTKTAERILGQMREEDLVARLGGDEFAVVATHVNAPEIAAELASRIIASIEQSFDILDQEVYIGASIGIALFPEHGDEIKTLTCNADTAMYAAKKKGRNNFQFFNQEMQTTAERHLSLSKEIRHAVSDGDIKPLFEVLIDLSDNNQAGDNMKGFVISPRWEGRPELDADSIIQMAESSKCLSSLRDKLFLNIKEQLSAVVENDDKRKAIYLSIFTSANQLRSKYLSSVLAPTLKKFDLNNCDFYIEVDEATVLSNPNLALSEFEYMVEQGYNICLSNFASGSTSLQLLPSLPIASIKLSAELIAGIGEDKVNRTIVLTTSVAKTLNIEVLAEGIENDEQLDYLSKKGCILGQGACFVDLQSQLNL